MTILRAGSAPSRALKTLVWASSLAAGASAVQAQSLTEVSDAARTYDATYLGARANADAAHFRYEQQRALHLPSATLTAQVQRQVQNTPYLPDPSSSTTDTGGASVNAQQTLFNRQNDLAIDEAAKAEDVARSQLAQAEQDLMVRVSQSYFDVLAATDALQTVQANKAAIAEQLASAKRNFEVGNATITDTREAEARFDLANSQEISAQNDLQVAHVTLDQLVGRNGVAPHPLALPATLPPVMPSQPQDWINLAEADSPLLKQAQLNLEIAQMETRRAKAGNLPTITAGATYGKQYAHNSSTYQGSFGVPTTYGGWGDNNGVSITLSVPLFAGFQIQNRERETVALETKARTDVEGARNSATLITRQTFLGAQSLNAQVKALEAAEVSSKLALDATVLGYKVGVKVNLDVLNAQSQLYTTQRDLAKARYDYLMSTLKLRQAAGTLAQNDLVAVNALLTP
jgi:outer membrane protein